MSRAGSRAAFTGDLTPLRPVDAAAEVIASSGRRLRDLGVRTIYPGHGPPWPLSREGSA